jgi:hypothetical protein
MDGRSNAGIQQVIESYIPNKPLDSRFRGNDEYVGQQWVKRGLYDINHIIYLYSLVKSAWVSSDVGID